MKQLVKVFAISFLFALSVPLSSHGQSGEFGIFLGGSYYNGEINPSKHVVVAKPAAGIFYDWHFNPRYSWRTIATYGQLEADDNMFDIGMNNFRDLGLTADIADLSGQLHFNFLEFGNTINEKSYTPYIFVGLSLFYVSSELYDLGGDSATTARPKSVGSNTMFNVAMPFGTGFKAIFGNFTVGLEWNFRKTFTDNVDGLENQYEVGNTFDDLTRQYNQPQGYQQGIFNTNDWYSFIGFTLSWRPASAKNACPAMD